MRRTSSFAAITLLWHAFAYPQSPVPQDATIVQVPQHSEESWETCLKRLVQQTKLVSVQLSVPASEFKSNGDPNAIEVVFVAREEDGPSRVSEDGKVVFLYNPSGQEFGDLMRKAFAIRVGKRCVETEVPRSLRENAECMYKGLQTVPGVSDPKLGYVTSDGWTHPYLEYQAAEASPSAQHPRFEAKNLDNGAGYWFQAALSGAGAPDVHISEAVMQRWKTRCGVDANILFP
jgi:hypothetical protein